MHTPASASLARPTIWPGVLLALGIAALAKWLADYAGVEYFHTNKTPISPVLCAVLFGALCRNVGIVSAQFESGLQVAATTLLRIGIALVGLKLTLATVGQVGLLALPVVIVCISVALLLSGSLAGPLKLTPVLSRLLAVGTAVCGCTAVMAVAPLIRARRDEMAYAVSCVVIFGVTAMLTYPWLAHYLLGQAPVAAGIFLGTAIHDTSQVIGAGLIYSQQYDAPAVLAAATTAKLLRNLSMVILIPWFAWSTRRSTLDHSSGPKPAFSTLVPLFVWAFLGFVVLRTLGDMAVGSADDPFKAAWPAFVGYAALLSDFLLTAGMAAVGLGISFAALRGIGWRPLATAMLVALGVGVVSLAMTTWICRYM